MQQRISWWGLAWVLATAGLVGACSDDVSGGSVLPELTIAAVGPTPLVPGTQLAIKGSGFVVSDVAELAVVFSGAVEGARVDFGVRPVRLDDETLIIPIGGQVQQQLIRDSGAFTGAISVIRQPVVAADEDVAGIQVTLPVANELTPALTEINPQTLYIGETIVLTGANFLHPTEGASLIELTGRMTTDLPPRTIEIGGLQVPASPTSPERRDELLFELTPDVLGIVPGRFVGQVSVVNITNGGLTTRSAPLDLAALPLAAPKVTSLMPQAASRGQWIEVTGQGFTPPDGLLQVATLLLLEGDFTAPGAPPVALTGPNALTLVPDENIGNTLLRAVLRVDLDTDGKLTGLGLIPGRFQGTVAPLLLFGGDSIKGEALPIDFEILPQRQIVYIKLLPGFDDALAEFGVLVEKQAIIERVGEVLRRDYEGISIGFVFEEPDDFAEYGVVEVAGRDPNGSGLFGLDNTTGKDVGNLRFDDIIGGYNAETNADGYAAYGGVFPGEFMNFSDAAGDNPLKSSRFDDIFGPVSPALGGTSANPGEGGGRRAQILEAVRVLGNLIGNTVSHEIGHSLGLSAVSGQFHNIGDNPGWIMDGGGNRPFSERAEIDGDGPAFFSPANRAYLEEVLPTGP